jgi:MFS family permease
MSDARWLTLLCASRLSFGFIFMAYSGALSVLMGAWSMSAGQAGLIHSGWYAGYLVSLFIAGILSDRIGAKRTFLGMSVAACASALLFAAFADSFVSALLLYALAGLCSGGSYTPGLTLIAERFEPARRGSAMGWFLAASSLGYALALFMAGAVLAFGGWRAWFFATAVGPLIGAAIAAQVLAQTENVVLPRRQGKGGLRTFGAVFRNRPAMLAIWSYAFHSWELLGLWAWLPAFVAAAATREHGATAAVGIASVLSGITFITNAAGSVAGGKLSDRLGRPSVMLIMTLTSVACSLAFGWLFAAPLWVLTMVAIVYNLAALGDSSVYSSALTELVPSHSLGAAYSLRSVLGYGLGAVSPLAFGLVLDLVTRLSGGRGAVAWGSAWLVLGFGALPGLAAIVRLRKLGANGAGEPTPSTGKGSV